MTASFMASMAQTRLRFPQLTPKLPQLLQSWSADKWLWPHSPFEAESDSLSCASVELPVEECTSPVLRRRSGQDCQQHGCSRSLRNPFTRHAMCILWCPFPCSPAPQGDSCHITVVRLQTFKHQKRGSL